MIRSSTDHPETSIVITWRTIAASLTRPYPVTLPMAALMLLVPFYIFIAQMMPERILHAPEVFLDRLVPLEPVWALIYGPLYLFLILLPVLIVRQEPHIRRTFLAYLTVWSAAYVCFVVFPTKAPRPSSVGGDGFAEWGVRFLYSADPPYNCFPSLHVAHSFVSALTSCRVNRRVGIAALLCASVVGVSTLFTKQHYVMDVIAGVLLAIAAHAMWLRSTPAPSELERRLAPFLAVTLMGIIAFALACFWGAHQVSRRS